MRRIKYLYETNAPFAKLIKGESHLPDFPTDISGSLCKCPHSECRACYEVKQEDWNKEFKCSCHMITIKVGDFGFIHTDFNKQQGVVAKIIHGVNIYEASRDKLINIIEVLHQENQSLKQ